MDLLEYVTKEQIEAAYESFKGAVTHTPLQYDAYLSQKYQANVYLKREDLQVAKNKKHQQKTKM